MATHAGPLLTFAVALSLLGGCSRPERLPHAALPPRVEAKQDPSLTDAEIARATEVIHHREIREAKEATKRATSPRVKQLAEMVLTDGEKALDEQEKLLSAHPLALHDGARSRAIDERGKETFASLSSAKGVDFDRAYLDAEIRAHEDALDELDGALLPSVSDADLAGVLGKMRGFEALHLAHAKEARQTLL